MKKIISFDLDGTLADLNFEKAIWLEEIPKLFARKNNLPIEQAKNAVFTAYNLIGDRQARWYDIKFWFKEFGLQEDYNTILTESSHLINLYPDTIPALKKLRAKGYKLIVISNATREFIDFKLKVEHLEKYFSQVFSITSDFNCIKGDSKGYGAVCKKLGILPSDLIHIGDDLHFDYWAASRVGIKAYYLNRNKKKSGLTRDKVVKNLEEFADRIRLGN
jgi:HAD superfamily hydrolase (TIGR01549 family)